MCGISGGGRPGFEYLFHVVRLPAQNCVVARASLLDQIYAWAISLCLPLSCICVHMHMHMYVLAERKLVCFCSRFFFGLQDLSKDKITLWKVVLRITNVIAWQLLVEGEWESALDGDG